MKFQLALILVCSFSIGYAQQDKIHLKNGSFLKGKIEALDSAHVKLLVENETITFSTHIVEDVTIKGKDRDDLKNELESLDLHPDYTPVISALLHAGMLADTDGEDDRSVFTVQIIGLYEVRPWMQLGIGIGYDSFKEADIVPLFFHYRAALRSHYSSPFVYGSAGFSKAWGRPDDNYPDYDTFDGGLMLGAGGGYQWIIEGLFITTSIGWRQQRVEKEWYLYNTEESFSRRKVKQQINMLDVKIGIGLRF